MGYEAKEAFEIVNQRDETITQFRLTHFMNGNDNEKFNTVVVKENFEPGEIIRQEFQSISGKDDHWFVQFTTLSGGCKMTKTMNCSMREDETNHRILITNEWMKNEWKKDGEYSSKTVDIVRVSKVMD